MAITLLVVDDSAVMRAMLIRTLRATGLPVTAALEASNGDEALRLLASTDVDVAMIDMNMPGMNGEQLIAHMRADPRLAHIAIVVVSTEGSEARIASFAAQGARFIHKPFGPEQVRSTLLDALGVGDA